MKSRENRSLSPAFKSENLDVRAKDLPLQMNASTGKKKVGQKETSSMSLKDKHITKSTN